MAQTYKFGNGTWATKKGSTLAYSDTNNAFKPLPFSFERNSIATRVNKEGLIEVVGNDIPRIDYTDSTEGALLLEPSRTNLITYSEDFTQWETLTDGTGVTPVITTNNSISPDGTQNADKIVFSRTSAGSSDYTLIKKDYGGSDINGIASIYLKSDANVNIEITSDDINYKTITVTTDWKRFEVSDATSDRLTFGLRGSEPSTLDATIYAWGAMLEANSVASSYIPTNGSTIQRAAETCNGSGNSEVFNDSQGVLFADIAALANDGTKRRITINNGSSSKFIQLEYRPTTDTIQVGVYNGASQGYFTESINAKLYNKIAYLYEDSNFKLYVSGFQLGSTITSGTTFSDGTLQNLSFDNGASSDSFKGKTKEIAYYDTALTDEELEYMTSYRSLNEMVTELNLNAL